MKANNAARVATKQQLEVLVSKLNEYTKRKPIREAEGGGVVGAPTAGAALASAAPSQGQQPQVPASPASGASDQDASANDQEVDGVPTIKNIVDQLNTLRSGRSLKDPDVNTQLERYFEGLDDSEKEAMHAYFKGVAQILSGQVDGGAAEEPKNHGVATQTSGKRSKNIKPNVIRGKQAPKAPPASAGAAASAAAAKPPRENTTPPAPIVPKKR
jgi:hypothetical protein